MFSNDPKSRAAQILLALLITIGFFLALLVPMLPSRATVDPAFGQTLQNMFILVIGYYFGSSSSASKKDDVIAAQMQGNPQAPVVIANTPANPVNVTEVQPK